MVFKRSKFKLNEFCISNGEGLFCWFCEGGLDRSAGKSWNKNILPYERGGERLNGETSRCDMPYSHSVLILLRICHKVN